MVLDGDSRILSMYMMWCWALCADWVLGVVSISGMGLCYIVGGNALLIMGVLLIGMLSGSV